MSRLMVLLLAIVVPAKSFAQSEPVRAASPAVESPAGVDAAAAGSAPQGTKYAIILCGLSGDADHRKLFAQTFVQLHVGLTEQLGFARENIRLLFGDEPQEADGEVIQSARRSTRAEFEKTVAELRTQLRPEDTIWVIVAGHSHYDGVNAWLNLPGPDLHQTDFAGLFDGMVAAQQVFYLTTPISGYFIKPLSVKGRVVLAATLADWETNETEFPHVLAKVLSAPPELKQLDVDRDGAISVFDLYLTVSRNVAQGYVDQMLLATEHGSLDDNGDGQGTELQIDYLTEEQGGRPKSRKRPATPVAVTGDGRLAKTIILNFAKPGLPPAPADPAEQPTKPVEDGDGEK